ncbi:MAG: hypothetical protein JW737_10435 [Acidobacteria bacterium]|nr:hypothetical protein [Acidobacteriota bacterium]
MKKYLIFIMFFAVSISIMAEDFIICQARWGMTKEEVRAAEKIELKEGEDGNSLTGKTQVLGIDTVLSYFFIENKLVNVTFVPLDSDESTFNLFEADLVTKYGPDYEVIGQYHHRWKLKGCVIDIIFDETIKTILLNYFSPEYFKSVHISEEIWR